MRGFFVFEGGSVFLDYFCFVDGDIRIMFVFVRCVYYERIRGVVAYFLFFLGLFFRRYRVLERRGMGGIGLVFEGL